MSGTTGTTGGDIVERPMRNIPIPSREEDFTADPVERFFDLSFVFAFSRLSSISCISDPPGVRRVPPALRPDLGGLVELSPGAPTPLRVTAASFEPSSCWRPPSACPWPPRWRRPSTGGRSSSPSPSRPSWRCPSRRARPSSSRTRRCNRRTSDISSSPWSASSWCSQAASPTARGRSDCGSPPSPSSRSWSSRSSTTESRSLIDSSRSRTHLRPLSHCRPTTRSTPVRSERQDRSRGRTRDRSQSHSNR